jgi:uncharacterized protein
MTMNTMNKIECRTGCGACCIAPSLSSSIPGMTTGKPAGVRCVQLTQDNLCEIYGQTDRPVVCGSYQASSEYCGGSRADALRLLNDLELITGREKP